MGSGGHRQGVLGPVISGELLLEQIDLITADPPPLSLLQGTHQTDTFLVAELRPLREFQIL
ncbi:hypothetical protein P376_4927 [Streptomyces sp. HCCB10043]|nr:hypothetical protein P376_4927 [Streptomyces sp. HCCB10043]